MVPSVRTVSALALLVSLTGACSGDTVIRASVDAAPFVERYSWFSFAQSSLPGGPAALFDDEGNLTPLGIVYQKYPL
ncbi:MAG: glycosyl hydrolase [Polyangiaceae bacterium]